NHALLDVVPGFAAVFSLPGQMPRSSIDHVGIHRINGDRFNIFDFSMVGRRDSFKVASAIAAAVDSVESANNKNFWIGSSHAQRAQRFAVQVSYDLPGLARVMAAV